MPVENDVTLQNGQDTGGGGGGGGGGSGDDGTVVVPPDNNAVVDQAPQPEPQQEEPAPPNSIVNGTHPKAPLPTDDQTAQDSPKDVKKSDGSASFLRAARAGNLEKVLEFLKTNTDINTCNANGLNALHLASKEGHVHVVTELLQRGASVDAATKKGNTALHIASLAGQEEIVKVLVQHQALVNIQSQNGFTPLYMAAQENHDNVVRFLLANNANQSLATEDGFTPLAVALQQGHDKVVAVLLENDTRGKVRLPALHIAAKKDDTKAAALLLHTDHNPDVTSKSGFTPLHIAAHYGNENIANLLIQRGADVNYIAKHQITPLHVASKWGKGNMVSLLIDKGANYEAKTRDGLTPLHCAARSGHETVVDMLLEKGAPITSKTKNGLAPLHMASQGDHVDAARILLYHKAPVDDVTVDYLTALHVAAHCGHVRVAKLLLDRKADPNSRALNGFTPLHIACKKNRIKVVELLLKHGASIEATTESGLTPLHVASFMGCMNIVIYLIQHGASADVPTVRGETPLHLAARANQTDIIRILLRNGAQVDARAREQQTALHIASRLGNSDIVVLLLQHGAAVDATTKDHYTALHIAAKEGQEEVASVLLEHGASLTSTTKKGFTPLHLAAKYGNMKVARLLLQKDAPVDAQGKNGVTPLHVAAHYDHQNVALLLLDKTASPHATAKNGYTPLHIAARKNQMDIATTLLEFGASANAESKAGFTPLHLSSQEGHTDMATLLIEHNASPGACAKNGLTPLHLCAQEDRVNVAAILVKHGAQIDPVTKAGYTPLHVASHFGQMNMVRFLLQHGSKVDSTTQLGYTPLHQAAQQGHTQIVNLLLENKAEPNAETNDGKTALSIAQRLGYISVVETLKIVTETTITTTTTTVTEEKYKVVVPETMHETFMSESEDEGGDDTMLGDQSYRYLTVDEMKSLGDDSLPIDVTKDEKMDVSFISNSMAAPPVAPADQLSPQHQKEQQYAQFTASYPSDNVDIAKTPILAGKLSWKTFLVSFMVDARGGAMRGCRHSGVRVIIPPRKAAMPMRITCRYLKKDKLVHAPPLMEGEALASRILEMGPAGAKFLGPVIIEVPHFASLRGKEREIVILRSDNGETWREHTLEATEEAVQEVLNESFDGEELKQLEDLNTNRITRILTTDFPQYFAIVTRIRQEVHAIGPEGGMVSSTVVPQVQAVFPQGALTKKIKVGLQAQPIPTDLVAKLLGNRVAVSPIVTVEPRRRKFHKPITLTIPVPQAASKGMINQYSGEAPTLRLLCSITGVFRKRSLKGGTTRAQWEDVTGSTPLTFVNDCVSFTTTVSARFWLMDCSNIPEATKMATELYREAIHVPFMAKFVVFSKRHQLEEARVRVFCMTDDREDKTLEHQEMFVEVAKSRDVEVLEGKPQFLEFAGNLVPVTKSGDQLAFNFYAFRENRLPFTVRVKDQHADCIGRVAFMRQPKVGRGDPPQTPICNLNIALPDNIQPEPAPSEPDLLALEKKYSFLSISKADTIHKADLRLTDISNMLGTDWVGLARELEISDSDINIIKSQYPDNAPQQAIVMLRLWMQTSGNKANGNTLEKGLRKIGRDDIVNQCIFNVELVTDDIERAMAKAHLDQSGFEAFREELGPSRDATLNRDISLDVSYDEQDMMKEAESAEEEEENQRTYQEKTSREQRAADMSPTYESEEKKYAGEEKIVAEEKVTKVMKEEPTVIATTTIVEQPDVQSKKEAIITDVNKEVIEEKAPVTAGPTEKMKEQMAEKVEEKFVEEKVEEKPIVDIDKHVEVVDKLQESKYRLDGKVSEAPPPSEMPEDKILTTTKVVEGPDGTVSTTTTTTERRSFVTSDDGAVQEHIVIEKRTAKVVDGMTAEEDKSDILQRLGEELGRLDEKLEEKFKEKRKTEEPEEGFTQTSVEKSQMSSTRGTADVSTAGTTVTTGQPVGDIKLQAGPGTHEATHFAEQQPTSLSHDQASSGLPTSGTKAGSDGGLDDGCPEAQGMEWEGKSVDRMYTETVVQTRHSMLPAVDTSEGVALSSSSKYLTSADLKLPTTHLSSDLPHPTNIYSLDDSSKDLTHWPQPIHSSQETPFHLHEIPLVEPQNFDISPSSVTKLSDTLPQEKGHTKSSEVPSQMVSSPSAASLQSESVAPFTRTDDIPAASVTFNTSSNFMSIGPVSPTEDSSEDHAEIDRTSTELSPDSVRFEQDILDTKTEDEAPDLDDDYLPASPVLGQELSDRIFSAEVTEDTDITTPMEMRDSHTERDATASNLGSVEDKEGTDGKVDIIKECLPSDLMGDDSFTYLCQETAEIHSRVVKLQELVDHHKVDLQTARSEAETIQNTIDDIQEAVKNSTYENNEEFYNKTKDIVATISSVSDNLSKIMLKLHSPDQGCSEIGSHAEVKCSSGETEIDMVNAESPKDGSPSDSNLRDQSLSDLLDSDDINRDSLEEEFDRLAAHLTLSPSADDIGGVSQKVTQIASPDGPLFPVSSSVVYPSKPPDALQATQREPDVGVVFTERKEYGGGVKPPAETTGGHSHISPSQIPHPSQSSKSQSFTKQKLPSTVSTTEQQHRPLEASTSLPSRPVRRHERTLSQATNIYTGTMPPESKQDQKKEEKEAIAEEVDGINENIKPYSERKQFWESVTSQSFESKGSNILKSETESDTDTTATDGTVIERQALPRKSSTVAESFDSEEDYVAHREDPAFYENKGFVGTEKIDLPKESTREGAVSPFEVFREEDAKEDLQSPEDIAFKDVSSKRALFEKEIKRQSMEIEESQSWKRSSKEYEDTVVISEESASSLLKKKEEKEHKIREMEEEKRKEKTEIKEELKSVTDIKSRVESKMEKSSGVTDYSETSESSRLHEEKMESKDKKIISDITKGDRKTITQTDISKEKKEKESIEKMVHERKDSHSGTFSKTVSTSEEKVESSSEAKEVIHTKSEDQDTSRDEITEEDMTRTEETSDEEPDDVLGTDKVTVNITEETRQLGDTHETIVRETTTTRDGDQEQRVIKETKTQETVMADGSTVKTTSITTFTTQLDAKDSEDESEGLSGIRQEKSFLEKDSTKAKTAKEKSAAFVEQMKSEMFSQELSSSAEDQSPEHKLITPKDVKAPVSLQTQKVVQSLASPILVPEENIQDVIWEASQERSDTFISETVQDIPVQQSYEHHLIKDISQEGPTMSDKSRRKSSGPEKTKLSEEEARKLAIEIVEEVKQEAVKRSPLATPSQAVKDFPSEGGLEGDLEESAAFTKETSNKIEKYIQEQLGDAVDEKQLKLIESVTARKAEILQRKLIGSEYQQSMEITDEDLRSSGAELSPIEHQMERLRQMTEEEDNQRYPREPSEADESESSMIIHDSVDDVSSEYDQANQMITKTLDSLKGTDITKPKSISTIEEIPEEREASQVDGKSLTEISKTEVKETARQLVKEVTEKAQESEALKQASLAAAELTKGASGSLEHSRTPSPKPGSRKGSCMDDEELRREFRRDYEDKKKMFKEEMTSDKQEEVFDEGPSSSEGTRDTRVYHQKSSESHKEVHMESSMTESMEESSTVESFRSFEGKMKSEVTTSVIKEVKEIDSDKKEEKFSGSPEEVVLRKKKTHIDEFNRRSGTDIDAYSSSGESHYFTAGEGTSDSRTGSRPCSSDVEALMSDRTATGTSEYDTAFTSQDTSQYSNYSTTSQEYRTAASSMSSRDSMKSIDSESSGNLASIELSEASETLVPSALELERDMDLLEQELYEEEMMQSAQTHQTIIPQLTIQSDTPKSEDAPGTFDIESDDAEYEPETKDEDYDDSIHTTSKMKRSMEMTFHPEPDPLTDEKKQPVAESVASSLEESTVSELSMTTVVEQETSLQGSTTDSNMTASSVSEQMLSSLEGHELERHISRTDSGVLTTETGDGDRALHSVTITATSVPSSTPDQNTASMCTQVTSETRSEVDLTESEQFFRANGPTEVDYVPEYDDEEVQGARPAVTPIIPSAMEVSGAVAGPSEGPKKVLIPEECYETEADQEYGQMMRESEYSDMAEAELQYSLEEQPEAEMSSMLVIDEPLERPKTPEPGFRPSSRPTQMVVQSPEEAEFTEVDKRFSAVFSTTYEEREEGARSLMPGMSIDIPDITITEHTLPMASQYCYPDLEREEDFPECRALAEADNRVSEIPATPGSQESASTCASRKSSSTDSEQGREYCLDDKIGAPSFGSFEMIEADDIDDISEFERTLFMHEERMMEMSQIKEEDEEYEDDDDKRVSTSPIPIPSQLKAVKLDCSVEQKKESEDNRDSESDPSIEEQRRWLELQFEESSAAQYEYSQGFIEHVYSGPLEDIEEEREDAERRDFSHITKNSSLSSTPEYDVLAGRKFFTRSGEHDDISMCSLQEFENLERAVAVEAVARRSSSGSQDSLNGRRPDSKSGQGDDISVGSFASLQEFERLEKECLVVEAIEQKAQEEEAMLSEIEEGHESQVSESESCETLSEPGRGSVDGEEYDQRMFEIDEIIRQAQTNVEKFDKNKPQYEGVQLRDIVSVDVSGEDGTGSSQADRTPSVGREEGDADSLEEAQLPELDLDQTSITGAGASSAKQDVMNVSTDSIEASTKNKVPRETSQDSLEKIVMKTDAMTASADSIEFAIRQDVMTTSVDSLEGRQKRPDPMSASTDSIEPGRRDVMASSIDSLGRDDSSGRDADISSGSEQMRPNPRDALMECSTDSLEPTSSQATHAYQYDTDSVMSGSFTSGCSNTLVASAEDFPDMMTSSLYLPEGELPPEGEQYVKYMHSSSGTAVQVKKASDEPGYSHTVTRVVSLPPEAHQVSFTGPDAQKKLEEFLREFNAGEHSTQDETVDGEGNVHIRRVTQKRVVADPSQTHEHGFSVSDPSVEESEIRDEHGNVTRVVRRTVVTTHTVEVDLDTGEPVQKFCPTTQPSSSPSSSSRIPRPVTSPPLASRLPRPGPPPGSRGPREPVPPSLEPNTVSGLDVEEMSNIMESYTSDGSDFFTTTTHTTTSIDPDPITSTQITRITRTEIKDGEIKEEVYEEY